MKRNEAERPSADEAIEATAAAWLAQHDDGLTPSQADEFGRWRAADARHAAAVARLEATWATLQQLRDFRPEARIHPDRNLLGKPLKPGRVLRFPAAVTAALAASLVVAAVWWAAGLQAGRPQHYATTVDGYERVTLPDGSLLELNSSTELSVQFTPAERRVRLVRGEAHFMVARNATRPFFVDAGAIAVRAVGTAFNVRLGGSNVEVLVTEGKVEVNKSVGPTLVAGPLTANSGMPASGSPTFLSANERVVIPSVRAAVPALEAAPPMVEKVAPEAVREALAWQGPRLVFLDTPLAQAVEQFNRRNQVQLELRDDELGSLLVGGSFRAENVDAFVRLLSLDQDIVVEHVDATHIALRKRK